MSGYSSASGAGNSLVGPAPDVSNLEGIIAGFDNEIARLNERAMTVRNFAEILNGAEPEKGQTDRRYYTSRSTFRREVLG